MPEDPTREFLAKLPRLKGFVRKPPSTVAISRSVIADQADESDRDLEAVFAWIETHGGRLVKPPPVSHRRSRQDAGRRGPCRPIRSTLSPQQRWGSRNYQRRLRLSSKSE